MSDTPGEAKEEKEAKQKEVENFGPTLCLKGNSKDYQSVRSERWIREHIFRWIPGSGYQKEKQEETRPEKGDV